ncbi:MAG: hypothetical protein QM572_08080, partial [Nocardioides sp.]|uniref:hypothetical protein n=1 Tax=Nocardioides sp. TaxID=35761 RepID=UPI0039E45CB0
MSVSRRAVFDGSILLLATAAVAIGAATWSGGAPTLGSSTVATLGLAVAVAAAAGWLLTDSTIRASLPVVAGTVLAFVDGSASTGTFLPLWALAVALTYRLLVGRFGRSRAEISLVVLAGAVVAALGPWIGHAPTAYERVLAGLACFAASHALLERLRPGSRGLAFGRRPLLLACAGVAA